MFPVEAFLHFWQRMTSLFLSFFFFNAEKKKTSARPWCAGTEQPPLWTERGTVNHCFSVSSFHLCAGLLDTPGWFETSRWRQWGRETGAAETAARHRVCWGFVLLSQGDIRDRYYQSSPPGSAPNQRHFITLGSKGCSYRIRSAFPRNILLVTINNAIKTELNKRITQIFNFSTGAVFLMLHVSSD